MDTADASGANSEYYVRLIKKRLAEGARLRGMNIESIYAGICADNTSVNLTTFKCLRKEFPKLFFVGCITHIISLMAKDVCSKFVDLINDCKFVVKFVRLHNRVRVIFMAQEGATFPLLFSRTRFCGAFFGTAQVFNL